MATVSYPEFLPLPQRPSQNMTQDTGWQTTQPAVGPVIFTPFTTDLKATWTLQWIFTLQQAERFKSWLRSPTYCDRGRNWFTMPIDLGDTYGPQLQTLHFVNMPVQTSKNGGVVTWTATVICNGIDDLTEDFDDWIVQAPENYGSWLDYLVTDVMPRVD
ncbi:TPA: hypothetical protein ORM06_002015 [Klebsiella aerogenes]|uniref:hypothetical protein n=1 Tax=Klebsiella aerogenes TaxID=548 RepID=UPI00066532CC|nr:hypothetical protein [Klebsiella aerogenes]MBK0698892.1 hypothetical protein [Klebsiella aerogenes]HCS4220122.1 hypothetical protein [Klebsiella aerogenes]